MTTGINVLATAEALRTLAEFIERHETAGEDICAAGVSACHRAEPEMTLHVSLGCFLRLANGAYISSVVDKNRHYTTEVDGVRVVACELMRG